MRVLACRVVVATLGRISGGSGYEYLTNSVATGAHDYYTGAGEAPGRWAGAGTARLGLAGTVQEHEMKALFGQFLDPRTVGFDAKGAMVPVLDERGRAVETVRLGAKPYAFKEGSDRQAVAGFDVQFAPSKSVSALWALAPEDTRRRIEALHDQAIDDAFSYLDSHVVFARSGSNGVRQIDAEGLIVARFQHRTSRNGDPQLHTHCAVLNRVYCPQDGKWRTLDATTLFREKHAAGAVYARSFEEALERELGVSFAVAPAPEFVPADEIPVGLTVGEVPFREIDGVPEALTHRWSSRRSEIVEHWAGLAADYRAEHGCEPTKADRVRMFQQATLATRRPKGGGVGLHDRWQIEAGFDGRTVAELLAGGSESVPAKVVPMSTAEAVIVQQIGKERARFQRAHVAAKAGPWLAHLEGEGTVVERIEALTDAVLASPAMVPLSSLRIGLEPPEPLRRRSGESQYESHGARQWSTTAVLAAERDIIGWATAHTTHQLDPVSVAAVIEQSELTSGRTLGADQLAAVKALTTSNHQLVTVIGPAGAGKTTMLSTVVDAYRTAGRKVVGLALSQNATNVLRDETGAATANIASWKLDRDSKALALSAGDLLVVDEAAMVPTRDLAGICAYAHQRGARVAFVGDPMQLTSPEAGGIITDLLGADSSVQLTDVRRFRNVWEGPASLALRDADATIVTVYDTHDRIIPVTEDDANATIVADWWDDLRSGRDVVIVADTNSDAAELAALCQVQRQAAGDVGPGMVPLADGNIAGVGDLIQTRLNDRDLIASDGRRVANRDTWTVLNAGPDGVLAQRANGSPATVNIPLGYLDKHAQLAYAGTIHAVQGRTVDVARSLITPSTGRSALYVAMTRGRHANVAYTVTDGHEHPEFGTGKVTAPAAFTAALQRDDRQHSARSTLAEALDAETSIATLTARQADAARVAGGEVWHSWAGHHLDQAQLAAIDHDPMRGKILDAVTSLVGRADLGRALTTATAQTRWTGPDLARRVAGAIYDYRDTQGTPRQAHVLDPDPDWQPPAHIESIERYVVDLDQAIDDRARMVHADATYRSPDWATNIPGEGHQRDELVGDIATYRDTWRINDMATPLGQRPTTVGLQQRAWDSLTSRLNQDLDRNGRSDHDDTYDRDGNGIDDQVDHDLASRVAALHERITSQPAVTAPAPMQPAADVHDWRRTDPSQQPDRGFER